MNQIEKWLEYQSLMLEKKLIERYKRKIIATRTRKKTIKKAKNVI